MKTILFLIALIAVAFSSGFLQETDLEKCIQQRCESEYNKCLNTKGCKDKLEKCEAKCGAKVAVSCWTLCIGTPGAAANVANCAVKAGCLNDSLLDLLTDVVSELTQ